MTTEDAMTDNPYAFWQWQIAGKKGNAPEYVATLFDAKNSFENPQPGFYRVRSAKGGPRHRVAIWPDPEGGIGEALKIRVVVQEREITDPLQASQRWSFMEPITEEQYRSHEKEGCWPDDLPEEIAPPMGHNQSPGGEDPFETLKEQIESARSLADKITDIDDEDHAGKASNLRDRLNQLSKDADAARVEEKRPHDEAARAVQQKWKPLVDAAKGAADALRKPLTAYLNKKEAEARAEAEAERKRVEEERRRQEAERARAAKTGAPEPVLPEIPEVAPAPEPVRVGGAYGKRTSLRSVTVVTITDYDACLAAVKDQPDVKAAVEKVATRLVKAGATIPGTEKKDEKVAA